MTKISIIIPTLNEENYLRSTIENTLTKAYAVNQLEVLVIDAGSTDRTLESIKDLPVKTYLKEEFLFKKYESLNFGIQESKGDILLFLDADTMLPQAFDTEVLRTLQLDRVSGGGFELVFNTKNPKLKVLQFINSIRYRLKKTYYGDQAVFCRKKTIEQIGGYPRRALMESAYLCRELRKHGKLKLIRKAVITSSRRFDEHGFFRVFLFDVSMWLLFSLNLPVDKYGEKYWAANQSKVKN